ncbi:MAG: DUF481 domain-containing protein [Gammaproteobacteria bacterium]|nr:DUF481 domain-containing protein [Gammaproteobacteria bacterium]
MTNPRQSKKIFILFAAAYLHCCYSGISNAQENNTQSDSITEQTLQPAENNKQQGTTDEATKHKVSKPVIQPVEATPQPPIIDKQPQPSYEPETNGSSLDGENKLPVMQAVETTPQPPLTDAQAEPGYEPDTADSAIEEENINITTQTPESSTDQATGTEPTDIEQKEPEETKTDEAATKWLDTRPERVSADWLQFKSGEWLRGRIIAMQDFRLEFYSDELKKLTIKWRNVRYIKSSAPYRLRFEDQTIAVGAIEITAEEVHVSTDYDDQTFDRSKLLTIASGKETESSLWSYNITLSINLRRGNTDQTDFTTKVHTKRQTARSRVTIDYLGNFTEVRETETINNHRLNSAYYVFFGRHLFLTPVVAELFRDPFQNIDKRFYVGTGLGYWLIKNIYTEWHIGGGPAYQSTKFDSVQPGQPSEDNTFTLILSTRFNSKLNSKVDLEGFYLATLGDESTGNYSHHSMFTVKTELLDEFYLDVSFAWDRTRQPVENAEGITPEQDDFKLLVGLRYDY